MTPRDETIGRMNRSDLLAFSSAVGLRFGWITKTFAPKWWIRRRVRRMIALMDFYR